MTTDTSATLSLTVNGEPRRAVPGSIADLVRSLDLDPAKVAVERNGEIVPRSTLAAVSIAEGDVLEIVHFVGGGEVDDTWTVAGRTFRSRLIVGTGKYKDFAQNAAAVEASGAEIVTVAVRRVNVSDPKAPMLTDFIDPKKITYLPNTAGCFTAEDAIRTLRLAREAGGWDLVKLEVLGEARTLYPNMIETIRATEVLAKEGFLPMVYCVDDPIAAKQLEDVGAVAVMPLVTKDIPADHPSLEPIWQAAVDHDLPIEHDGHRTRDRVDLGVGEIERGARRRSGGRGDDDERRSACDDEQQDQTLRHGGANGLHDEDRSVEQRRWWRCRVTGR